MALNARKVLDYMPQEELIGEEDELEQFLEDYIDEFYDILDMDVFQDPLNDSHGDILDKLQRLEQRERINKVNDFMHDWSNVYEIII